MELGRIDIARVIAADLLYVRCALDQVDEAYRTFRTLISGPDDKTESWPIEWIPISDH